MSWVDAIKDFEFIDGRLYLKISDNELDSLINDLENEIRKVNGNLNSATTTVYYLTNEKTEFEKQLAKLQEYKNSI